jgi:hypothetical protein
MMSPDAHPSGVAGVVERLSQQFREAYVRGNVLALRTPGTGTTSLDCPLTGIGGVPFEVPGPPEYLNAELMAERRDGKLFVTAINTGEAAWAVGDCTLVVSANGGTANVPIAEAVPRFGRVRLELKDPGGCELTMRAGRFGPFGQRVRM